MDTVKILLEIFKPDFVFSLAFFIGFIGFGVFFSRQVWPWLRDYMNKKLEYDYQIARQRWEVMQALSDDLRGMKSDFAGFHENQRRLLDFLLPKAKPPVD